jgi:hypothetical protein
MFAATLFFFFLAKRAVLEERSAGDDDDDDDDDDARTVDGEKRDDVVLTGVVWIKAGVLNDNTVGVACSSIVVAIINLMVFR